SVANDTGLNADGVGMHKVDGFFVLNLLGGAYAPGPGGGAPTQLVALTDPATLTPWSTSILPAGWTNNSYVDASTSTLPILVFGNAGSDTIIGGAAQGLDTVIAGNGMPAGNVLFGHFGRVQTVDSGGNLVATYGYGGRGDLISSQNLPSQWIYSAVLDNGGNTKDNSIVIGAPFSADDHTAQGEDEILIGGAGNNMINGGIGDDLIFGHNVALENIFSLVGGTPIFDTSDPRFRALTGTQIYTDTATTD